MEGRALSPLGAGAVPGTQVTERSSAGLSGNILAGVGSGKTKAGNSNRVGGRGELRKERQWGGVGWWGGGLRLRPSLLTAASIPEASVEAAGRLLLDRWTETNLFNYADTCLTQKGGWAKGLSTLKIATGPPTALRNLPEVPHSCSGFCLQSYSHSTNI